MATLSINNLRKEYPNKMLALVDFTFESKSNEFVVVLGPSGCGKSTLLNLIAGLEKPTDGTLLIDQRDVTKLEARDRDIAMVFQDYALYPHMSVFDNIGFYLKLHGVKRGQIKERVVKIARTLQIEDLLTRKPNTLSGGQQQRVAIARAMIRSPKVYLLDEPLSSLDAALREKMRTELIDLHTKSSSVFFYVTHDQMEALAMGDRIIILNKGLIQQVGSPRTIYDHPANLFVAEFIGTPRMNFIEESVYRCLGGSCKISEDVSIGIRPENIRIAIAHTDSTSCNGQISFSENLGKEIHYHIRYGNQEIVVCVASEDAFPIPDGTIVKCTANTAKFHYFDKKTGCALNIL